MKRDNVGFVITLVLFIVLASIYVAAIVFALVHGALYVAR